MSKTCNWRAVSTVALLFLTYTSPTARAQTWSSGPLTVTAAGRVGIGTTDPADLFHVKSGTNIGAWFETNTPFGPGGSATLNLKNASPTPGNSSGIMAQNGSGAFTGWMDFIHVNHSVSGLQSGAIAFSTANAGSYGPRMYIKENGGVGIGTTNPLSRLEVWGPSGAPGLSPNSVGVFRVNSSATQGLDIGASGTGPYSVWIQAKTTNPSQGAVAYPLVLNPLGGNVGIGTSNPMSALAVNGTITAKEIVVTNLGWADYVFRPTYRLRPLSEVSEYIRANHHLPEIPTEVEVKEKGVGVGEMQTKLLAKIEELTLYMIQVEETNRRLQDRVVQLEKKGAN